MEDAGTIVSSPGILPEDGKQFTPHPELITVKITCGRRTAAEFCSIDQYFKCSGDGIQPDDVAILNAGNLTTVRCFRCHVDGSRHLAGGTRHSPVSHESHLVATILEDTERRRETMQFGHAVGFWSLEADDGNEIPVETSLCKCVLQFLLVMEDDCRSLYDAPLRLDG